MKYVVSRIENGEKASEIIQDVNIAKVIHWVQMAWKDMSIDTIIYWFQKCGFKNLRLTALARTAKSMRNSQRFLTNFVMMASQWKN